MDYTSSEVNAANGFDRASWPNITDNKWATQVYKAYGERPYWKSKKHKRDDKNDDQASARAYMRALMENPRRLAFYGFIERIDERGFEGRISGDYMF